MSKIGPEWEIEDSQEPIQSKFEFYIRNHDDAKVLVDMLNVNEMKLLLWNIQQGINSMRNGKNGIEYGFYRYRYDHQEKKDIEYTLDEILDRMSEYIYEELAARRINLED